MPPAASRSGACTDLLRSLIDGLCEAAPHLNEHLPFPQRTALTGIVAGEVRGDGPNRCSATVTIHVGDGAEKDYVMVAETAGGRTAVTVSDEADFEERVLRASAPGEPFQDRDVRAVYDALSTDLAGHFGTDS